MDTKISSRFSKRKPERWLLALESSTENGGAALLADGEVRDEIPLDEGLRHGRDLLPAAKDLLVRHNLAPGDIWAIGVSIGPGSYTGTRVGVMSAKAFSYASGCKLAAVSSLAALAASLLIEYDLSPGTPMFILQDARRDEVYAGLYEVRADDDVAALMPDAAIAPEEAVELYAGFRDKARGCVFIGSGFSTYQNLFKKFPEFEPLSLHTRAAAVALLSWRRLSREEFADPMTLQPAYLRRDPDADWTRDILISQMGS